MNESRQYLAGKVVFDVEVKPGVSPEGSSFELYQIRRSNIHPLPTLSHLTLGISPYLMHNPIQNLTRDSKPIVNVTFPLKITRWRNLISSDQIE